MGACRALLFAAAFFLTAVPVHAGGWRAPAALKSLLTGSSANGTYVAVSYPDSEGEREEAGARLHLEDSRGKILDSWESAGKPKEIIDKVKPGEPHRVVEETPAPGEAPRPPKEFIIPGKGSYEVVLSPPGTGGENSGSGERDIPGPSGEENGLPGAPAGEVLPAADHTFRIGFLTVEYGRILSGTGRIRIGRRLPGTWEWIFASSYIGTGDEFPLALLLGLGLFSLAGLMLCGYFFRGGKKKQKRLPGRIFCVPAAVFVLLFLFSQGALLSYSAGEREMAAVNKKLRQEVFSAEPAPGGEASNGEESFFPGREEEDHSEESAALRFGIPDTAKLEAMNPDYVCWIKIPETGVDYPVVRSRDNEEYLTRSFSGEDSPEGTLFLDAFSGEDNIIIHGHNRRSGAMFGTLDRFCERDFLEKHKEIWIFRDERWEKYLVSSVISCPRGEEKEYQKMSGKKQLILSTCLGDGKLLVKAEREERMF